MSTWEATDWDPRLILIAAHMHASSSCMALRVNLQADGSRCHNICHGVIYCHRPPEPLAVTESSLQPQS